MAEEMGLCAQREATELRLFERLLNEKIENLKSERRVTIRKLRRINRQIKKKRDGDEL